MSGALLVAGTSSDAGKSVISAGLCRWLRRTGLKTAPFKAQNMALNSSVTADGAEVGRAQAAQAHAARVPLEAVMNPVLLKPSADTTTQVICLGRPWVEADARSYRDLKHELLPVVTAALDDLRSRFDVVVCEGAGSPAEINLREHDFTNLGLARAADIPVICVGDIDRGGVFASFFGTLGLLEERDQRLVAGFVVNRFRGDERILAPGCRELERRTGRPVVGVVPWVEGLWLDAEDSLTLDGPRGDPIPPLRSDGISVAVVRLRRMSNFTDADPLACEPGVAVRFTRAAADVLAADLVIVPGTKATVSDLERLRAMGLDRALARRAERGDPVLGICGGYQMLGRRIHDRVESGAGEVQGLGLLPVLTEFDTHKTLTTPCGVSPAFGGTPVGGYEIRHGNVRRLGGEPLIVTDTRTEDGCRVAATVGTSWHGIFEHDAFRRAFLGWVAERRGLDWEPGTETYADLRDRRLERLADLVEDHLDTAMLLELIESGPPEGLPTVHSRLEPA